MKKHALLNRLYNDKLVGIVRGDSAQEVISAVDACVDGGLRIIEVPFTLAKAHTVIDKLSDKYHGTDVVIGAGSVLDTETARIALLSGAEFIVTPALDEETIKLSNRYNKLCTPGVMTLRDIVQALELGIDLVKIFPAGTLGCGFMKAARAPLPQASFMPTGGVSVDNAREWLENGASALALGSCLTQGSKNGDFKAVEKTARQFRDIVDGFCQ